MVTEKLCPCYRCKRSVPMINMENLIFESRYKRTELLLCNECFLSCREAFEKWMKNVPSS